MKFKLLFANTLFSLVLPGAVIYQQDFESSLAFPAEFSGTGAVQTTGGLNAFGFGSNHLRNDSQGTTVLTLTGLAAHTSLTLSFDLALWDTIDVGDFLTLKADNVDLIAPEIPIAHFGQPSTFGVGPGILLTPGFTGADFSIPNYGYNAEIRDSGRRVTSLIFSHTASSVVITFAFPNSQGGFDESFGIDNIVVQNNIEFEGVPEPSTFALGALALTALYLKKRR